MAGYKVTEVTIKINGQRYPVVHPGQGAQVPPWQRERKRTKWHSYLTPDEMPFEVKFMGGGMGYGRDTGQGAGYAYADGITAALPYQVGLAKPYSSISMPVFDSAGPGWNLQTSSLQFGRQYVAGGRYVVQLNNGVPDFYYDCGAGTTATDLVMYNGKLYVAYGSTATPKIFSAAFTTNTPSAVNGGINVGRLVAGRKGANGALWGSAPASHNIYSLIGTADPTVVGSWDGPFPVGDASTVITQMYMLDYLNYVHKTDGLYAVDDSGNFRVLLPEIREYPSSTNGLNGTAWFNGLLMPESYGLLYYNQSVVYQIGTEVLDLNDTPVKGPPVAAAVIGQFVWYILKGTDSNYYLLWGREPKNGEFAPAKMVWHPVYKFVPATNGTPVSLNIVNNSGSYFVRVGTTTTLYDVPADAWGRPVPL